MRDPRRPSLLLLPVLAPGLGLLLAAGTWAADPSGAPSPGMTGQLQPYGPARNGSLVYEVDGDLWTADSNGYRAVAIVTGPDTDSLPSFSRDGTMISFVREHQGELPRLMVARADGSGIVELASRTDQSDWSADGRGIVVNHDVHGKPWVSIVASDGSSAPQSLDLGDIEPNDGWAAWRPTTGSELIFTGHPRAGSSDMGLYSIRPDGTGLRTIGAVSTAESDSQISFGEPQLSPDGSRVAYWNWEKSDAGVLDGYLHVRDLETGTDQRLAVRPLLEAEVNPRFSPDGRSIVIEAQAEARNESQLVVGPVDGSGPGVAIGPVFSWGDPLGYSFSPDGTQVILTLPDGTVIIDVASGATVATLPTMPSPPTWQRLAP